MPDLLAHIAAGVIGALIGAAVSYLVLVSRVQRLEIWAWGPQGGNGADWSCKRAHERIDALLKHDRMQDARNWRQHPTDQHRDRDGEAA